MFDKTHPLWLPEGSVRSVIAFLVVGSLAASEFTGVSSEPLRNLAFVVVGFYFAKRGTGVPQHEPQQQQQ